MTQSTPLLPTTQGNHRQVANDRMKRLGMAALLSLAICAAVACFLYLLTSSSKIASNDLTPKDMMILPASESLIAAPGPSYSLCKGLSENPNFKITGITSDPFPVKRGDPFSIVTSGHAAYEIDNASVKVTVKVLGISVYSKTLPAPKPFVNDWQYSSADSGEQQTIPSIAPSGTYTVELSFQDSTNSQLTCIDLSLQVV